MMRSSRVKSRPTLAAAVPIAPAAVGSPAGSVAKKFGAGIEANTGGGAAGVQCIEPDMPISFAGIGAEAE